MHYRLFSRECPIFSIEESCAAFRVSLSGWWEQVWGHSVRAGKPECPTCHTQTLQKTAIHISWKYKVEQLLGGGCGCRELWHGQRRLFSQLVSAANRCLLLVRTIISWHED
jgi:hypothetical protein